MKLSKEMTMQIEVIHRMNKEELYETYGDMISENAPKYLHEAKLELAYLIYDILHGKEPNEFQIDLIYCHFMNLEMENEMRAYSHSRSTQRIIKKIYSNANI